MKNLVLWRKLGGGDSLFWVVDDGEGVRGLLSREFSGNALVSVENEQGEGSIGDSLLTSCKNIS
jgi:hypothetical protein